MFSCIKRYVALSDLPPQSNSSNCLVVIPNTQLGNLSCHIYIIGLKIIFIGTSYSIYLCMYVMCLWIIKILWSIFSFWQQYFSLTFMLTRLNALDGIFVAWDIGALWSPCLHALWSPWGLCKVSLPRGYAKPLNWVLHKASGGIMKPLLWVFHDSHGDFPKPSLECFMKPLLGCFLKPLLTWNS